MTIDTAKLSKLRELITEGLRVQRDGESIEYINVGHALEDACSRAHDLRQTWMWKDFASSLLPNQTKK